MSLGKRFIIPLFGIFIGCVLPIEIDLNIGKKLVIEARLTNDKENNAVKLSYTSSIYESSVKVSEAMVRVINNTDTIYYTEEKKGVYKPPEDFRGIPGHRYRLEVKIDDKLYRSTEEELKAPVDIERIHGRITEAVDPAINRVVKGFQFFIDTYRNRERQDFFYYEWEGTHNIIVPLPATHHVVNSQIVPIDHATSPCYSTTYSNSIELASTVGITGESLRDVPIRFLSEGNYQLANAYSLKVTQFRIDRDAYQFLKNQKKNNESGGSLNDIQLGNIPGNVFSDDGESAIGYFLVAGVSEKRRMFKRRNGDFGLLKAPKFPFDCGPHYDCNQEGCSDTLLTDPTKAIEIINFYGGGYLIYSYDPYGFPASAWIHTLSCTDCSWYASTVQPDFWE